MTVEALITTEDQSIIQGYGYELVGHAIAGQSAYIEDETGEVNEYFYTEIDLSNVRG